MWGWRSSGPLSGDLLGTISHLLGVSDTLPRALVLVISVPYAVTMA